MTTDTVTAKLAEWEALAEGGTEGEWRADSATGQVWATPGEPCLVATAGWVEDAAVIAAARQMVPALLGFVREVLTLIDEDHCPGGCEHDAIDAEVLGDRIKRALMEQIGGEG
jgi:hypothetical protein